MNDAKVTGFPLSLEEARLLLTSPPSALDIQAPCTAGDGVERWEASRIEALNEAFDGESDATSCGLWVPASGAASRMFARVMDSDDALLALWARRAELACGPAWEDDVMKASPIDAPSPNVLRDALMHRMAQGALPKGLVPFHTLPVPSASAATRTETAFEAHVRAWNGVQPGGVVWFTVPEGRMDTVRAHVEATDEVQACGVQVRLQIQDPATNTPILGTDGNWLCTDEGEVLTRPGGHGTLLPNLSGLDVDMVVVRNIDNAPSPERTSLRATWTKAMVQETHQWHSARMQWLSRVRQSPDAATWEGARAFLNDQFREAGVAQSLSPDHVVSMLELPMRLVAVVKNEGQPGGGPCWALTPHHAGGMAVRRQIVEAIEFQESQRSLLAQATHFNPVDMVCVLPSAVPLPACMDSRRFMVAQKRVHGNEVRVLEYPGLWNGGMSDWLTRFVEIPAACFQPVKTILDLVDRR